MLKSMLKATVFAASLIVLNGAVIAPALAEVVYNRGNDTDPTTLDHQKTSTVAEGNLMRDLYEGLVVQNAKAEVVSGVAESWQVSDDGLKYTFKLRQDAKWSNGDPMKASDFVFAYRRVQDAKTAAPYANMLYPMVNAEAINKGEKGLEELGVKAVDDHTLEITLNAPTPYFLELLTHQIAYPLHQASVEKFGEEFTKPGNMVTNGAYMLESFTPNDKIVMRKNPHFHDAANVKIDVVKPYSTLLANFSASSSEDAVATDRTGPKISSLKMRIDGATPSKIVGWTKKPLRNDSGREPPVSMRAPSPCPSLM